MVALTVGQIGLAGLVGVVVSRSRFADVVAWTTARLVHAGLTGFVARQRCVVGTPVLAC